MSVLRSIIEYKLDGFVDSLVQIWDQKCSAIIIGKNKFINSIS